MSIEEGVAARNMDITVESARRMRGIVEVPGDKSIAHRALILGAMAQGEQVVAGLPPSEDVASTAACLRQLGCSVQETGDGRVRISSDKWVRGQTLYAGNSGTTARLLAGLIAGKDLDCTIDGDASLRQRPMQRISEPLVRMGANVETAPGGCLPMRIRGPRLTGITYEPPVASAQVKSAVLIAGLHAEGSTTVIETVPTRDHTENMLEAMGVLVDRDTEIRSAHVSQPQGIRITVPGGARLQGVQVRVPGDISSTAFYIVAATILPDSDIRVANIGINPTRTGVLQILEKMGARIALEEVVTSAGEPIADIIVRASALQSVVIDGPIIPRLIDELPILAVAATQAEGVTIVQGAGELRHKESDRIRAIVENLSRLGADIEEREDGFVVTGPCSLMGATVSSYGDHRIAMALAVAGLIAEGCTTIENSEVVGISYPDFFSALRGLLD